jgi:hypothetical protein
MAANTNRSITVVSMLRLKYLIQFAHTDNVTWDYLPIGYWSAVEAHVGVMVACLPAIRSLQRSIREKIWPKPVTANSYYEDDSRNSSKKQSQNKSASRKWSSKTDTSRVSRGGKEDFVRLDEFEMGGTGDVKKGGFDDRTSPDLEASLTRSNEDVLPLATTAAPFSQPPGRIRVDTRYSIDRSKTGFI